jgi:hypothetical protein
LAFYSTPPSLRRQLTRCPEVARIKAALRDGTLPEATVRRFVEDILGRLKKGERFPNDSVMAALAVIFEDRFTPFAEEYLCSLASLKLAEMSSSTNVAKLCLARRPAKPVVLSLSPCDADASQPVRQPSAKMITGCPRARTENKIQQLGRTGTC